MKIGGYFETQREERCHYQYGLFDGKDDGYQCCKIDGRRCMREDNLPCEIYEDYLREETDIIGELDNGATFNMTSEKGDMQ